MRLQYYWKLDKNIPHAAHHWDILFTSLTLTQGIKIFLSLEERYIILKFDFDFTNLSPSPPAESQIMLDQRYKAVLPFSH